MRRVVGGGVVVGCVVLGAQGAVGGNLSVSLKNFYAEFEVVKQCAEQAQLTAADADLAKTAIAKVEAHYLERDASIDKDRVLKAAIADKDEGFRIATRNRNSDLRHYCRLSLKELLTKAEEIDPATKP
ncbi:MAG TPA: hypothetical protein VLB11_08600 [Methyloceanibacter sp.]|nr:hypothetical protein [Methyloceanibacter sp.]